MFAQRHASVHSVGLGQGLGLAQGIGVRRTLGSASSCKSQSTKRRKGRSNLKQEALGLKPQKSWARRYLIPSRFCCWMIVLFFVTVLLLLSAGGLWAYKSAPADGESPPFYPSPPGGTHESWMAAYQKASDLVRKMSVVGVSYGGFVGYSMAAQFPEKVDKVVLCCAGVALEEKDMDEGMFQVKSVDEAASILLPQTPANMKKLIQMTFAKPMNVFPSCFLNDFIDVSDL